MSTVQQGMESEIGLDHANGLDQYLTFLLDGEEYGVDILRVQEIRGWDSVTRIPNTPDYIQGVINLRGTIVPIIDLRMRFGLEKIDYGITTVVVVLKIVRENRERILGLVVDAVSDVYDVPEEEVKEAPNFGTSIDVNFVRGLTTANEKMVIILNVDNLFDIDELNTAESLTH